MKFYLIAILLFFSIGKTMGQEKPIPDTLMVGGIVFEKVVIENGASEAQWKNLLEENLVPVIKKARKKLKAGSYTIHVRFLKEKDGTITDVRALNDPGYGLAEAASNVVMKFSSNKGPKWNPGEANQNDTRSYGTQSITFQIKK
jgi:protein TonB